MEAWGLPALVAHAFLLLVFWFHAIILHDCLESESGQSVFKVHRSFVAVVMASQACLVHLLCTMV
jgi:hypothetical protein